MRRQNLALGMMLQGTKTHQPQPTQPKAPCKSALFPHNPSSVVDAPQCHTRQGELAFLHYLGAPSSNGGLECVTGIDFAVAIILYIQI